VRHGIRWAIRRKDCIIAKKRGSLQNWGIVMIRKIVIAGVALGAIVAFRCFAAGSSRRLRPYIG
jgi:hypothetical protein